MSNLVSQIIDAMETRVETATSFSKLRYVYNIERNDYKGNQDRYAVTPGDAPFSSGIVNNYTVDQSFIVSLTTGYRNSAKDDLDLQASVDSLYSEMDEVIKDLHLNKAGLPGIVLSINLDSIDAPEILEEHKVVVLRADFVVKYRNSVG